MNIFQALKGQWGLTRDADFRPDPWYIVAGKQIVDSGFGKPPKEFFSKALPPGVVMPGLVNAHSHIELSFMAGKVAAKTPLFAMASIIHEQRRQTDAHAMRQKAAEAIHKAREQGTFFFCDIGNDAEFIRFLRDLPDFQGNRYLELLGFSPPSDRERIEEMRKLLDIDATFYPTVHSVYGSSPLQMRFVREKARHTSVSIHLLESPEELEFQYDRGAIVDFLKKIGQYVKHPELQNRSAVEYLHSLGMLSFKKLLLVHLSAARVVDIELLEEYVPHAAWVLCHRSNKHLGIERSNWETLRHSSLKLLIGTDSLASNSDLSVLQEMKAILDEGKFSERELLRAATWDAYEYLEIKENHVPYFLFPGAQPNITSLSAVNRAMALGGS